MPRTTPGPRCIRCHQWADALHDDDYCGGPALVTEPYQPRCDGSPACEVHPTIRQEHPRASLDVEYDNGDRVSVDYSGDWEAGEKRWELFKNSDMGRAILAGIEDEVQDR
jgi:hypothetical protein